MKRILSIGLLLIGFAVMSQAQTTPPPTAPATKQETKKQERKKMMADMNLSADQKKQMKSVNKEYKGKEQAIKGNQSLSKQQKKDQLASLKKEKKDKMGTFLTPEQQSIAKEDKKSRQAQKGIVF